MVTGSMRRTYCNSQPTTSQTGAESGEFSAIVPLYTPFIPHVVPSSPVLVPGPANVFLRCGNFNDYFPLCSLQLVVVMPQACFCFDYMKASDTSADHFDFFSNYRMQPFKANLRYSSALHAVCLLCSSHT